jgi:predicted heme/steroid binding protein
MLAAYVINTCVKVAYSGQVYDISKHFRIK